jgi:hypothetical protein
MATYTVTNAVAGVPVGIKPQLVEVVLDFSTTTLVHTADVVQAIEMKANTLVLMAGVEILTAGGAGSLIDLGDTDDDLWVSDLDGNTANGVEMNAAPKLYTAADTLDLSADTASFSGKVRVFALMAELGAGETAAAFA